MQEINIDLLRKLIFGAAVTEKDGVYHCDRFTEEQRSVFSGNPDFYRKTYAASCVRMEFVTDAGKFLMDVSVNKASSRFFYYFDIALNGTLIRSAGAESYRDQGEFHLELPLDGRKNRVCIYFPSLVEVCLKRVAFEGASVIEPIRKKYRIVSFGDSITQGYDARHPSVIYPNQVADALDAEVFNKGIGGDRFNPALAACPDPFVPDLVTAAYGTNDWSHGTRETLLGDADRFFDNLTRCYPRTPIAALLPIWRKDLNRITKIGFFTESCEIIRSVCRKYPTVRTVAGLGLVPHLPECFSPDGLHPNDFGFLFMGRNLIPHLPEL